ncbi:hypothetical protein MEZE111188_04960 [Mesobacillus zeae]
MCIQMLNDCAEICFEEVALMARNSQFSNQHCKLCADICDACAGHCEQLYENFRLFVAKDYGEINKANKRITTFHEMNKERDTAIVSLFLGSGLSYLN